LNFDKIQLVPAACILAELVDQQLVDQFYEDDILQHKSIQGLVNKFRQGWFHHEIAKEAGIYYQPVLAYQPGIKCSDIPPDTIIPLHQIPKKLVNTIPV